MIKSMTGFASLTHEDDRATLGITVRAVNHRFLDVQLRIPQSMADLAPRVRALVRAVTPRFPDGQLRIPQSRAALEPRVRALLQKRLARGRVELAISMQLR